MRLLNVATLALEEYMGEVGQGIPPYAILSHTWEDEEVSFTDYISQKCQHKKGYEKIKSFCQLADAEGFRYAWVDTCCIDKTSSAELSEAINSMFQWYQDAGVCYAYLADVDSSEDPAAKGSSFSSSRWFTRGWTLQELLAPTEVVFLGSDWDEIGTKKSLSDAISAVAKINRAALGGNWDKFSVAQKMSWASGRRTTRLEDEAYCLMGLFDITMPLLYGEGHKAFLRLQQEILKISEDQSIFAWSYPEEEHSHLSLSGLLASSPKQFRDASQIEASSHRGNYETPFEIVNRLVRIRLRLLNDVQAVQLQLLTSKPTLYSVIQVHQYTEAKEAKHPKHDNSSSIQAQVDHASGNGINKPAEVNERALPMIRITSGDGNRLAPPNGSGLLPQNHELKIDLEPTFGYSGSVIHSISAGEQENETPDAPEHWVSYIYEPIIIAPLKCHIQGNTLGILLSRHSVEHAGFRVLSRLHRPSIVTVKGIPSSSFASLTTSYASLSTSKATVPIPGSSEEVSRFSGSVIRVTGVLSAGYTFLAEGRRGWSVDESQGVLRQVESKIVESAPLLIFHDRSRGEELRPTFFVALAKPSSVYVGLTQADAALVILNYTVFSTDLTETPRVEIPLSKEVVLVIKFRNGAAIAITSLSIETSGGHKPQYRKGFDQVPRSEWFSSNVYAKLRAFLRDNSSALGLLAN